MIVLYSYFAALCVLILLYYYHTYSLDLALFSFYFHFNVYKNMHAYTCERACPFACTRYYSMVVSLKLVVTIKKFYIYIYSFVVVTNKIFLSFFLFFFLSFVSSSYFL